MADAPAPDAAPPFKDRLVFDTAAGEIRDAARRYILLRPEGLMNIFRTLPPDARRVALQAFEDGVYRQGSDSARAYRAAGGGDVRALLATIERTAPQLGWGRWSFTVEPRRLRLTVDNSPFAHAHGPSDEPVCRAIGGMLRGLAEMWFDEPAAARETTCAAAGQARCTFEAVPATAS
jgi:predicted hydrocarbon binding protein